ncbi:MAG: hypothetical protein Q9210_002324 [Variospora velana]
MSYRRLSDPLVQNILAGVILGLGPGIYVAITLLGAGGGPANYTRMVNVANAVLYAYVVVCVPPRSLYGSRTLL